jgi:glycogenin glucosyltransferase
MLNAVLSALSLAPAADAAPASKHPSQILVLGMHHSGTSVISNLTMMLGAYGGSTDEMLLHAENPLKFWERRDVVTTDEERLESGMNPTIAAHYEMPNWVGYGFEAERAAQKINETSAARGIVARLNEHRPWVTKDPRMCLVAEEWMQLLDAPVCVIVHRSPLSVANSMMIYSHNVSLAEWASVYEAYYTSAMRACEKVPTVVVEHDELRSAPYTIVQRLYDGLVAAGVQGLSLPSEARVARLLHASPKNEDSFLPAERKVVSRGNVAAIEQALKAGTPVKVKPSPWLVAPRKSKEAFATLLTTANRDYLRGALVLGSSIRSFDSTRDLVCLVTKAVPSEWRSALEVAGWIVKEVQEVQEFWWGKSSECSKFDADQSERWGHMATKLRLWQMQYERVMYLDADTVMTGDVSNTFATVRGFAAEKARYHSYFNAGVMLLTPSEQTFDELSAMGAGEHKALFGNVVDCTEQGLLNSYFDGSTRPVTKLSIGRADVTADWESSEAPFAVHWITHVCPKPWVVADGEESVPAHCDQTVYTYWNRVWNRLTASAKDESSASTFGSREAARRKLRRLSGVSAGPSMAAARAGLSPAFLSNVHESIGRQLRELVGRRLRRRRWARRGEYENRSLSEGTWAWIAIIGTLGLGLSAGALLHKLFIKAPEKVGKGMTVVQAKRMGFQALGAKGPVGVVSAVDDDDDDDEGDDEDDIAPPKK